MVVFWFAECIMYETFTMYIKNAFVIPHQWYVVNDVSFAMECVLFSNINFLQFPNAHKSAIAKQNFLSIECQHSF